MKKPLFLFMTICFGINCSLSSLNAQVNLTVHSETPGGTWFTALENIRTLSFTKTGVTILQKDNTSAAVTFDALRKLSFDEAPSGIDPTKELCASLRIQVLHDQLIVKGWDENRSETVRILSMNGIPVTISKDWNGQPIAIGSLTSGTYLLCINRSTFKFCKL